MKHFMDNSWNHGSIAPAAQAHQFGARDQSSVGCGGLTR